MTPEDRRPRRFQKIPDVPGCPCVLLCLRYLLLHCIMSSCHHVIFILHLNLNKSCGPSVHLNRGKCDFFLKHILPIFRELYYKYSICLELTQHTCIYSPCLFNSSFTVKTLPIFLFPFIEVPPKTSTFLDTS